MEFVLIIIFIIAFVAFVYVKVNGINKTYNNKLTPETTVISSERDERDERYYEFISRNYEFLSRNEKTNEYTPNLNITIRFNTGKYNSPEDEDKDENNNFENFDFYSSKTIPAQGNYRITYVDQKGLKTDRVISVKRVYQDENGNFALDAQCHLRNAHRSFIDSKILNAVDFKTGEIIKSVAEHAISKYRESGTGKSFTAIEQEWEAVQLLVFVARADGRMMKAERYVIADYLKRRCRELVVNTPSELDNAIKEIVEPDYRGFKRIIAGLKSSGDFDRLQDITNCAKRIVATKKTVTPIENDAIELLEKAIVNS